MDRTIRTCEGRTRPGLLRAAGFGAALPALALSLAVAQAAPASAEGRIAAAPPPTAATAWGAYLSARHASRRKDSGRASAYFETAAPEARNRLRFLILALRSHVLAGRMERATAAARRIVALSGGGPTMARLVLALHAAKQERFGAAQDHLDRIAHDNVMRLLLPLLRAWMALGRHKDADLALDEHRDLEEVVQFRPFRLLHRAYLLDVAGRPQRAAEAYAAVTATPAIGSLRVAETRSNFLFRAGDAAAGFETIDRFLAANPDSMTGRLLRARYEADAPVAPPVGSPADGAAEALINVASALDLADRPEQALPLARLAVWMRPRDAASAFALGAVLDGDSRHRDAIAVFRTIGSGNVYNWEARKSAAAALVELGRYDEASAILEKMAAERPGRFDALWLLGNVHRSRSAFAEAVVAYDRAYERIADIAPRHWNLLYARGIALERSGQWPRAERDFLRALKLNPGQPYVLNYLAYSWVDRGERLERARGMLEEAVRKRPNDGYIVDSVGWVEYRLGNFEAAVRHLERATELRPHDPIINRHLGDAYWRAGRRHEARFQWRRALWLGPEEAERKKTEERLRNGLPAFRPIPRQ